MSGLDEILNIIDRQQKEQEAGIMKAAENKVREIQDDAAAKAEKAYSDHMKRAAVRNARDFENACFSADAEMKRKILAFKVEQIDLAVEKALAKLRSLPDKEYFDLLSGLIEKNLQKGSGVISLGEKDLRRLPDDFEKKISLLAEKKGGAVTVSGEEAPIEDGFILTYGSISENCSFRSIIDSERDSVRDTAAKELFG